MDVKLYDKRNSFPFSIVRLPFSSSNIPPAIFYNCVGAEVIRIGRVSSLSSISNAMGKNFWIGL